jgi:hypothetical protein
MFMNTRFLEIAAVALWCGTPVLHAQQPPPPPPPPPSSGGSNIPGGNLDLSKIPIPPADVDSGRRDLTEDERKGPMIRVNIIPVGHLPPPIIYIDKSGMPREKYRDPLEYAPSIFHVKTRRGSVRLMASQNQVGPTATVPKLEVLELSYETHPLPPEDGSKGAGPSFRTIGSIPIAPESSHIAVILWKDEEDKLWTKPQFKVIDISPTRISPHEALVVNFSGTGLALSRGDKPYLIRDTYVGKVGLPVNDKGQVLMMVYAASAEGDSEPLSQSVMDTQPDERVFLLAWKVPKDRARPSGVAILPVSKQLFPPPPPPPTVPPVPAAGAPVGS